MVFVAFLGLSADVVMLVDSDFGYLGWERHRRRRSIPRKHVFHS